MTASTSPAPRAAFTVPQERRVLLLSTGTYGNVLRFLPSLPVTDVHLADAARIIDDALAAL